MEEHLEKEEEAFREVLSGGGKKRKAAEGPPHPSLSPRGRG
jgi:hypothetical protein